MAQEYLEVPQAAPYCINMPFFYNGGVGVYAFYIHEIRLIEDRSKQITNFLDTLQHLQKFRKRDGQIVYTNKPTDDMTPATDLTPGADESLPKETDVPIQARADARLFSCTSPEQGFNYLRSSATQKELAKFIVEFNKGNYNLNLNDGGAQEARHELNFGRDFEAAYSLLIEEPRKRTAEGDNMNLNELMPFFAGVSEEERYVDALATQSDDYMISSIYLRALEQGECSFPNDLYPSYSVVIDRMNNLRFLPKILPTSAKQNFERVYNQAVEYTKKKAAGGELISAAQAISVFRKALIASARH